MDKQVKPSMFRDNKAIYNSHNLHVTVSNHAPITQDAAACLLLLGHDRLQETACKRL